jgi:hypothetical protein
MREHGQGTDGNRATTDVVVVERNQFRKHVGSHMEQLALFAIPRTVNLEDDDTRASSNAVIQSLPEIAAPDANKDELSWPADPPLHVAAFAGDVEEVRHLLSEGADIEAEGETWGTTRAAAEAGGNAEIIEILGVWRSTISPSATLEEALKGVAEPEPPAAEPVREPLFALLRCAMLT